MRLAALLLLVAACRTESGPGPRARVRVLLGNDQPAAGARVYAHASDGTVTGEDEADAVGIANVPIEEDSLITVRFSGDRPTVITTLPPELDTTLEVHGPPPPSPFLVVGTVTIDAPPLANATYYEVDVGCVTLRVTQFPEAIDVTACSTGADRTLDVLVRGFHDAGAVQVLDGYAAMRVPILSGLAVFDIPAWQTTGTDLPLTVTGVSPELTYVFYVDGNGYGGPPIVDGKVFAYLGLEIERSYARATLPNLSFDRYADGLLTMEVTPASFLPPIAATTTRTGSQFAWEFAGVGGDVVVLSALTDALRWDAALPPDATSVVLPEPIALGEVLDVSLRYIDSSELADFSAVRAAGIYATTVVPSLGDIKSTAAAGLL